MIQKCGQRGKEEKGYGQMSKFDWSKSDGDFRKIVGMNSVEEWVKKCNEVLQGLRQNIEDQVPCTSNEGMVYFYLLLKITKSFLMSLHPCGNLCNPKGFARLSFKMGEYFNNSLTQSLTN